MYYIKSKPNDSGNYGNPTSTQFENSLMLPDELLSDFIKHKGFVTIKTEGGKVTSLEANQEALDAYLAEYPDVPEPEPEPTAEELLNILLGVEEI